MDLKENRKFNLDLIRVLFNSFGLDNNLLVVFHSTRKTEIFDLISINMYTKDAYNFSPDAKFDEIFANKFKNMSGYSLRISMRHKPYNTIVRYYPKQKKVLTGGIDMDMFKIIRKKLNVKYNFAGPITNNAKLYNEILMERFLKGRIDVSLDHDFDLPSHMDRLYLPKYKDSCVFMPFEDKKMESSLQLVHPFQGVSFVMVVVILFICITLNWKIMLKFPNNILCYVFFGGPVPEYRKTFIERYITILVVVFFAIFNEMFLLNLTNLFTLQESRHQFKTFEEYVESDSLKRLKVYKSIVPKLIESYPTINGKLVLAEDDNNTDSLQWTSSLNDTGYAFFTSCSFGQYAELDEQNLNEKTGLRNFYLLKIPFSNRPTIHAFKRFSPFRQTFSKIWYQLFEMGIDIKLERHYKFAYNFYLHASPVDPLRDLNLSPQKLLALWIIYLTGVTLSCVVFVVELIHGKKTKNRRMEKIVFGRKDNSKITDFTVIIYRYMYDLKLKRYSFSHFRQCEKFKKPRRNSI